MFINNNIYSQNQLNKKTNQTDNEDCLHHQFKPTLNDINDKKHIIRKNHIRVSKVNSIENPLMSEINSNFSVFLERQKESIKYQSNTQYYNEEFKPLNSISPLGSNDKLTLSSECSTFKIENNFKQNLRGNLLNCSFESFIDQMKEKNINFTTSEKVLKNQKFPKYELKKKSFDTFNTKIIKPAFKPCKVSYVPPSMGLLNKRNDFQKDKIIVPVFQQKKTPLIVDKSNQVKNQTIQNPVRECSKNELK